jgi:hypothetical protein
VFTSPTRNSPAKNRAALEAVNNEAESIIAGYDRWKFAETNGLACLNVIHNLKEKSRTSSETESFTELETYCKKLKTVESIFVNIIEQISVIRSTISASLSLGRSTMKEIDQTQKQVMAVDDFLRQLESLYKQDLSIKRRVIRKLILTHI